MYLKNYTSDVPVSQTLSKIESALIHCGVSGIAKEYAPNVVGKIVALTFIIRLDGLNPVTVRVPVDEGKALQCLWLDYANGEKLDAAGSAILYSSRKKKKRADFIEQAERTAWKLMQDWIEVQLSLIQMKQADFMQVFLPYVWNGKTTFYESMRESNYRGLLTEKTGE